MKKCGWKLHLNCNMELDGDCFEQEPCEHQTDGAAKAGTAKPDSPTCPVCECVLIFANRAKLWVCPGDDCIWTQPDARQRPRKPEYGVKNGFEVVFDENKWEWQEVNDIRPAAKPAAPVTDKQKRDAAVDAFATAIRARLDEQAAKGYTGWDAAYPWQALAGEIADDSRSVERALSKCIDIGARAMMLHFRKRNGLEDGAKPAAPTEKKPVVAWWHCERKSTYIKTVDGITVEHNSHQPGFCATFPNGHGWVEIPESEYLAATGKKQQPAPSTPACLLCREHYISKGSIYACQLEDGHAGTHVAEKNGIRVEWPAPKPIKVGDVVRARNEEGVLRFNGVYCVETTVRAKLLHAIHPRWNVYRIGDVSEQWLRANCEFRKDGTDGSRAEDWEVR